MPKKIFAVVPFLLILLLGALWLLLQASDGKSGLRFAALFWTPISFYGKVVDQFGQPVPDARVELIPNNKVLGEHLSTYVRTTDAAGNFSIRGIHGITLAVEASKSGYQVIRGKDNVLTSSALFEYGVPSDSGPALPTRDHPAIFALYKYGPLEPLTKIEHKMFRIARNGAPVTVSLDPAHQVVLRCWNAELSRPDGQRQYDWSLEISVVNGGIIQRENDLISEAPVAGYQPSERIEMPASLPATQWKNSARRSYFVRFDDDVFARVNLDMEAGGGHFFIWESFLNPKAGSRNLEFDPTRDPSR